MEAKLSSAQSYLALVLFCVLGSASYLWSGMYAGLGLLQAGGYLLTE